MFQEELQLEISNLMRERDLLQPGLNDDDKEAQKRAAEIDERVEEIEDEMRERAKERFEKHQVDREL